MISIARKNLFYDKPKFLISIGGVAMSILLILSLFGIYFGITEQSKDIPLTSGTDYWITEKGARNLFNSASLLPAELEDKLAEVPGVSQVVPIINRTTTIDVNGRSITSAVIGYDTKTGIGKAGTYYKGADNVEPGEVIIDRAMSQEYGLGIDDDLHIGNMDFKVVGISNRTNALEFQYLFIGFDDAQKALEQPGVVNYYLVNLDKPMDDVKGEIAKILPNGEIKTKETMAQGNSDVISQSFAPIVGLLVIIGLVVGILVVGLTVYTSTVEKSREYGVLKAIGIKNSSLYSIAIKQTVIISLVGFALGLVLYAGVKFLTFYTVPLAYFSVSSKYYLFVLGASTVSGITAAYIPIRKINRIDPLEAFRK